MRVVGLLFLSFACLAQDSQNDEKGPKHEPDALTRPFAVNLNLGEKWSNNKRDYEFIPSIAADYRFGKSRYRMGLSYGHNFTSQDNTLTGSLNIKILEWGKPRAR